MAYKQACPIQIARWDDHRPAAVDALAGINTLEIETFKLIMAREMRPLGTVYLETVLTTVVAQMGRQHIVI